MANEQILTIKLNVDTTNIRTLSDANKKIEDSFKAVSTSSNELTGIEQKRLAITNQQYVAQAQLLASMQQLNEASKLSTSAAYVASQQAIPNIQKYNAELEKARIATQALNNATSLGFGAGTAQAISRGYIPTPTSPTISHFEVPIPTAMKGSFSGIAGLSQGPAPTNEKAYYEAVKALEESHTRHLQEQLKQEEFATKASYNSRKIMYNELFGKQRTSLTAGLTQAGSFAASPSQQLTAGLSASGLAAIKDNVKALENLTQKQKEAAKAADEHEKAHRGLILRIVEGVSIYKLYNATVNAVWNSLKAIPKIGIELDSTRASLLATIGSSAGAESALSALRAEALRTGIQITALRESFRGFQASTSLAGVSLESTWKMFTNLDTVITGLHLSTDKANGIFLAMAQIFNKGKVQSEELVKQLGNLLPGAFSSMAASMGISTIELSKQMKNGMVYAQDVMENFTEYMKNRFAPAFAAASEGLNANIGRMKNSFTNLGEVVYAEVSPTLLEIVKNITSMTNSFTDLITHFDTIKSSLTALANIGFAAIIVSISKYIGAISLAGKGTFSFGETIASAITSMRLAELGSVALTGSLTILRGVFMTLLPIAVVTGIVTGAEKLWDVFTRSGNAAEEAAARMKRYKEEQAKLVASTEVAPIAIKVESSQQMIDVKKLAEDQQKNVNAMVSGLFPSSAADIAKGKKDLETFQADVIKTRKDLTTDYTNQLLNEKQLKKDNLTALLEDIHSSSEAYAEKESDTAAGAGKKAYDKYINAQRSNLAALKSNAAAIAREVTTSSLATPEQGQQLADIEKARVQIINDAKAKEQEVYNTKAKTIADKAETEASKIRSDAYANLERDNKNEVRANEDKLIALDNGYKNNVISISDYYAKRNAIINANRDINKQNLGAELNIAIAGGKQAEIDKVKDKQIEANRAIAAEERQTFNARSNDEQKLADLANKLTSERLTAEGNVEEAAMASFAVRHKAEIDLATANLNNSNAEVAANSKRILSDEKQLATFETLNKGFKAAEADKSKGEAAYNAEVTKTNALVQLGVAGQFQSFSLLDAAREKQLAILEKTVAEEEKSLAISIQEGGLTSDKTQQHQEMLDKTRTQFQLLKEEGTSLSRFFSTSVGGAMEASFAGLITGSMNAKQAFSGFATSVLQDIAKIIANEARSAIIGQIFSAGKSMFGGTPTTFSGVGALSSFANVQAKALGGVSSNPGLSALSGTVLNKPTIIPFASGAALAGEAGPEAIMPLAKDSSGKLGVKVSGNSSGQSGGNVYNISVNVQAVAGETSSQTGTKVAEAMMTAIAQREINNSNRLNGTNNRVTSVG